jgi:thiamine-phosphate diphosphorylase
MVRRVAAAAAAGVHLIQLRDPDADGGVLARLTARCIDAVRSTTARVIVNDRIDVALAARAHGVHLRGDSMPASRARMMAPPRFIIGRSVHSLDETHRADADGAIDYLIFGTVFSSVSKPSAAAAGPQALAAVVRSTALPVLAIGGVSAATASQVAAAGAAGFAAIGLFAEQNDDALHAAVAQASLAFDTLGAVP